MWCETDLNGLLSKGILNRSIQETSMPQNRKSTSTNQPEQSLKRSRQNRQNEPRNSQSPPKLTCRSSEGPNLQISSFESSDTVDASYDYDDKKEKWEVGNDRVDGEEHED